MIEDSDEFGDIDIGEDSDIDDENVENLESLDDLLAQSAVDDDDLELLGLEKKLMEGKMASTVAHNFLRSGAGVEAFSGTKSTPSAADSSTEDAGTPSKETPVHEKVGVVSSFDEESSKLQKKINELKWADQSAEPDAAPNTDDLLELICELEAQNTSLRQENANLQVQVNQQKGQAMPESQSDATKTSAPVADLLDRIRSLESTNQRLQDGHSQLQDLLAQAWQNSDAHKKTITELRAQLSVATAETPEIIKHHPFLMDEKVISFKKETSSSNAKPEEHLQSPGEGQSPTCLKMQKIPSESDASEHHIELLEMENIIHTLQERIMVLVQDKLDLQTALDSLQHEGNEMKNSMSPKGGKDGVVGWFSPSPERKKSIEDETNKRNGEEREHEVTQDHSSRKGGIPSWFSPSRPKEDGSEKHEADVKNNHEDGDSSSNFTDGDGKDKGGGLLWFSQSSSKKERIETDEHGDPDSNLDDSKSAMDTSKKNGGPLTWFQPLFPKKEGDTEENDESLTDEPSSKDKEMESNGGGGLGATEKSSPETQADILKAIIEKTHQNSFAGSFGGLFGGIGSPPAQSNGPQGSDNVDGECTEPAKNMNTTGKIGHKEDEKTQAEDFLVRTESSEEFDGTVEDFAADNAKSGSTKTSWSQLVDIVAGQEDAPNGSHPPPLAFEDLPSMLGSDELNLKRNYGQTKKNQDDEDDIIEFRQPSSPPVPGILFQSNSGRKLGEEKVSIVTEAESCDGQEKEN